MLGKAKDRGLLIHEGAYNKLAVNGEYQKKLHNSLVPMWWIAGWRKRDIFKNALVHKSVFRRIEAGIGYRPRNLPKREAVCVVN